MIVISLIFHLTPTSESLYPSGENLDLSFCKPPILPLDFSSLFRHCLLSSEKRRVLASLIWAMQLEFLTSNKLSICDLVFCILLCLQGAGPFDPAPQSWWIFVKAAEPWPKLSLNALHEEDACADKDWTWGLAWICVQVGHPSAAGTADMCCSDTWIWCYVWA